MCMTSESLLSCFSPFLRHLRNEWPWISLRGHPRRYFFSQRVIDRWNCLEQSVIDSATINAFKTGLSRTRNIRSASSRTDCSPSRSASSVLVSGTRCGHTWYVLVSGMYTLLTISLLAANRSLDIMCRALDYLAQQSNSMQFSWSVSEILWLHHLLQRPTLTNPHDLDPDCLGVTGPDLAGGGLGPSHRRRRRERGVALPPPPTKKSRKNIFFGQT